MDYKEQAHKLELRFKYDRMGLLQLSSDLCKDCSDAGKSIIELLVRAETSEERCKELEAKCKRLDEARERANEAAHKWETMYRGKKEELEMSKDEVSTMSTAGMEMLNAFSEYVRSGSKNPAAYCYYGADGCGGDGDGCKGAAHCNFLPKSGMKGGEKNE